MSKKKKLQQYVNNLIAKAKKVEAKQELQLLPSIDQLTNEIYDRNDLVIINRIKSRRAW